ncbi:MAG: hypothetical protein V3573_00580 [Desulfovibrionaceae bacterium]
MLLRDFQRHYPDPAALRDSTAAARVNGFLGGYGDWLDLRAELPGLGLSEPSGKTLMNMVQGRV